MGRMRCQNAPHSLEDMISGARQVGAVALWNESIVQTLSCILQ